jgi:hypothetical protein
MKKVADVVKKPVKKREVDYDDDDDMPKKVRLFLLKYLR